VGGEGEVMKRLMVLGLVAMSGCVTIVEAGKPMSTPPKGFEWCGPKPLEVPAVEPSGEGGELPPSMFRHCSRLITETASDGFVGTTAFGVTTNDFGYVTSVCFWGANYAHGDDYVECIGKAIASTNYRLDPNHERAIYKVTFVLE